MNIEELAIYYTKLLRDAHFKNINEIALEINNLKYEKSKKIISRDDKIQIIHQIEKELKKKTKFFNRAPILRGNAGIFFKSTDSKDTDELIKILLDNID